MNRITFISLIAVTALIATSSAANFNNLVWSDEFNGNALDKSKWQNEVNCDGGGNNELQCYTARTQNTYVEGGYLHLRAIPENYGGKGYTSGRINTAASQSWKYGRFVTRAKLPRGDYLWPAIWMMPKDSVYGMWAASGEIDIMESRGQTPRTTEGTLHHGGGWPNNVYTGSGARTFDVDFTADFHIFELIWERDQIQWLVDGKVFHTQSLTRNFYSGKGPNPYKDIRQPFDQRFFFILNVAIGGGFFGANANALNQATARAWPQPEMLVDYVRVYQEGGVAPNPVPVPTQPATAAPQPSAVKPSLSVGVSIAVSSAASSAVSSAASSAVSSAASSRGTTYYYSEQQPIKTAATPAPSQNNNNNNNGGNVCPAGGCGANSCCNDARIGTVCYSPNTHSCPQDENGKYQLCGKGLGSCNGACYDTNNYKCVNSKLAPK